MATRNAPKSIAKGGSNTNGILQVNGAQTSRAKQLPKPAARLKVIIRRLPPGLLESELKLSLGEEWEAGKGKVDYFRYKKGKESKDGSKQSRPSWAVLRVVKEQDVKALDEAVRSLTIQDAANTWNSSCLVGPPIVEYATFQRLPTGRVRQDARQGTIDQDPEFMAFLDSLVNPVTTKEEPEDGGVNIPLVKGAKVTVTPLVQFIKDKKAKRTDKVEASKATKTPTKQEVKSIVKAGKTDESKKTGTEAAKKEKNSEKAPKESPKIMSRPATTKPDSAQATIPDAPAADKQKSNVSTRRNRANPAASSASSTSTNATVEDSPSASKTRPSRIRASAATAASILQRDLGLGDTGSSRRTRADAAKAAAVTPPQAGQSTPSASGRNSRSTTRGQAGVSKDASTSSASTPTPASASTTAGKAAQTSSSPSPQATQPASAPQNRVYPTPIAPAARRQPQNPTPSNTSATRAFVKHANPSQGVTEPLLKIALEEYGKVNYVEIDKRKGFAYVEFADHEGLRLSMKNSPIKVGAGTVVVLERKDKGVVVTAISTSDPQKGQAVQQIPQSQGAHRGGGNVGMTHAPHPAHSRNIPMRPAAMIARRGGRGGGRGGTAAGHVNDRSQSSTPELVAKGT